MTTIVNDKLELIAKKKQDLLKLERILKEKEKQKEQKKKIKMIIEIGNLAVKANLDKMDKKILFGAFIEISQRSHDNVCLETWKKNSEIFEEKMDIDRVDSLSLSFKSDISEDLKSKLKNLKFRWNKFRREYYGYANKHEIESLLNGLDYILEVIP